MFYISTTIGIYRYIFAELLQYNNGKNKAIQKLIQEHYFKSKS